jgi:hypothetical protein
LWNCWGLACSPSQKLARKSAAKVAAKVTVTSSDFLSAESRGLSLRGLLIRSWPSVVCTKLANGARVVARGMTCRVPPLLFQGRDRPLAHIAKRQETAESPGTIEDTHRPMIRALDGSAYGLNAPSQPSGNSLSTSLGPGKTARRLICLPTVVVRDD